MTTTTPSTVRIHLALLLLGIASSLTFLYCGSGILFGAFGGPGPVGFSAPRHWPVLIGYLVGLAEFGGGIALFTGVLFRVGLLACSS